MQFWMESFKNQAKYWDPPDSSHTVHKQVILCLHKQLSHTKCSLDDIYFSPHNQRWLVSLGTENVYHIDNTFSAVNVISVKQNSVNDWQW